MVSGIFVNKRVLRASWVMVTTSFPRRAATIDGGEVARNLATDASQRRVVVANGVTNRMNCSWCTYKSTSKPPWTSKSSLWGYISEVQVH